MSVFSSVKGFFGKIGDVVSVKNIQAILGDLGKLFTNVKTTFAHLTGVIGAGQHLFDSVVGEVDGWKNFKEDIRLKSRVINLESAITKTRDLILGIPASWRAVLDIFSQVRKAIAKDVAAEEGAALLAIETAGLSEIAVAIGIFYQVLSFVADMISDIQTIVDELKALRLEVEKLDTIFLSQSNKRKRLKLANGKSIRIRVGKLHHLS
jgi:hypothetical protein